MRRFLLSIFSFFLIMFVILILLILVNEPHWSLVEVKDTTPRKIPVSDGPITLKDTYKYAQQRVNEWRRGAYLHGIMIEYVGSEQIKQRKGLIRYFFYIRNQEDEGLPHVRAIVDINTLEQKITKFEAYGGYDLGSRKLNIDGWQIDNVNAVDIAVGFLGTDYFQKHTSPKIRLRATYNNNWIVEYHPNENSYLPDKYVIIDALTGEIGNYEK